MTSRMQQRLLEFGDVLFFDGVANCNNVDYPCLMFTVFDGYGHPRVVAYAFAESVSGPIDQKYYHMIQVVNARGSITVSIRGMLI